MVIGENDIVRHVRRGGDGGDPSRVRRCQPGDALSCEATGSNAVGSLRVNERTVSMTYLERDTADLMKNDYLDSRGSKKISRVSSTYLSIDGDSIYHRSFKFPRRYRVLFFLFSCFCFLFFFFFFKLSDIEPFRRWFVDKKFDRRSIIAIH